MTWHLWKHQNQHYSLFGWPALVGWRLFFFSAGTAFSPTIFQLLQFFQLLQYQFNVSRTLSIVAKKSARLCNSSLYRLEEWENDLLLECKRRPRNLSCFGRRRREVVTSSPTEYIIPLFSFSCLHIYMLEIVCSPLLSLSLSLSLSYNGLNYLKFG